MDGVINVIGVALFWWFVIYVVFGNRNPPDTRDPRIHPDAREPDYYS